MENELLRASTSASVRSLHAVKRELIQLRKSVWPLREVINILERGDFPIIKKATRVYLRDLYDQVVQVMDTVETHRDIMSGMLDVYLSSISNRTNAVMKVLTVITTIFMPMSLLAGIYGMNFRFMPGLASPLGFFVVIGIMGVIAFGMITYFLRKGRIR